MKLRTIGIVLCAGALAGCAAKKSTPRPEPVSPARAAVTPPPASPSGHIGENTVTGTATVVRINQKTRHVTLKGADGKTVTIVAGPEVRNLAQVKKGDVLRITYHESMASQVKQRGHANPAVGPSTEGCPAP